MKFGVIVFPGSNCDADCYHAVGTVLGQPVDYLWHGDGDLDGYDCLILPGGFTYGDYLRVGAIARFARIMRSVERFAADGGLVLGICNGFQILCEAGLLPGALLRNDCLRFRCDWVGLRVENGRTPFTNKYLTGQVLRMPIAHGDGRYYCDQHTLDTLEREDRVIFRYCDSSGATERNANPNGSLNNIAGICSRERNVLGLMPHPERCCEPILGGTDGLGLFTSLVDDSVDHPSRGGDPPGRPYAARAGAKDSGGDPDRRGDPGRPYSDWADAGSSAGNPDRRGDPPGRPYASHDEPGDSGDGDQDGSGALWNGGHGVIRRADPAGRPNAGERAQPTFSPGSGR